MGKDTGKDKAIEGQGKENINANAKEVLGKKNED